MKKKSDSRTVSLKANLNKMLSLCIYKHTDCGQLFDQLESSSEAKMKKKKMK